MYLAALLEAGAEEEEARWVYESNVAALKLLLEAGARTNLQEPDGESPLHMAAFKSDGDTSEETWINPLKPGLNTSILKLLLRAGAEVDSRDKEGETPLTNVRGEGGMPGRG